MGIVQRLLIVREQRPHFLIALAVIPVVVETHPVRVVHVFIGLDAEQHVLGGSILPFHVMDIVGDNQLHAVFFRKDMQLPVDGPLFFQVVVLHFQKEIVFAENINIFPQRSFRPVQIPLQDHLRNFSLYAGRQADDALAVFAQDILIDAGLAVKAVNKTERHQLHQIVIAFLIFRQQDQMVTGLLVDAVKAAPRGNVTFTAEDDLDAGFSLFFCFLIQFLRRLVDVHRAVHIAVVGDGNAVHPQLHGALQQLLRFGGAV